MPYDSGGVYTRPVNSFSNPVLGTTIDPVTATALFADFETAFNHVPGATGYRTVTAAGDITASATDRVILANKAVGAATNVNLPTSASRNGIPLTVKDYKRDSLTNNITFVLAGVETIDGLAQAAANTAGLSKIDVNGSSKTLYPLTSGGWYTL